MTPAGAGVRACLPILIGTIPFGLVAGAAAADIGIGVAGASVFSVVIFAGAAQLAALDLLGRGAPVAVAVGTAIVINLRMLMYSASLAPLLAREPLWRRMVGAYVLTDQAYALTVIQAARERRDLFAFYAGAALAMWANWQLWTVVGAVVGSSLPPGIPLGFTIPLMFIGLLVPAITDRPAIVAAVVAAVVAVLAAGLPANLGMPLGATLGIVAGVATTEARARRAEGQA